MRRTRAETKTLVKNCQGCGLEFKKTIGVSKQQLPNGNHMWVTRKFCSRPCARKWNRHDCPGSIPRSIEKRLHEHTDRSQPGCWNWKGKKDAKGYGFLGVFDKTAHFAHREAYRVAKGPLRANEIVRHTCDNPACVNPQHLISGTKVDNVRDRQQRGRQAKGLRCRHAYPREVYQNILAQIESGMKTKQIHKDNNCSQKLVQGIRNKKHWFVSRPGGCD